MNYAQFEKEAKSAGLYDSFSQEDLDLARKDPAAGMKILGYKQDYNNATTDEARTLANAGAESVRRGAGYLGGEDGSGYTKMDSTAPSSFGYTFEDVVKEAQEKGVYSQFSDADIEMAKKNADYGMATVYNKVGYNSTTDSEEKAKYHQNQEELRSSYGGYTGGADGSGFVVNPISPQDFTYEEAPTYESTYQGDISNLYKQIKNYKDFTYSPEQDPLFAQYKKQYQREGQRATEDTMGQAAAMTGGIPSSYAVQAAAQAGNYHAAQLADKVPELYEAAYNRYMDKYAMLGDKLKVAQGLEDTDYARHLDDYAKWKDERTFGYGQFVDEINNQKIGRDEAIQSQMYADSRADTAWAQGMDEKNYQLNADALGHNIQMDEKNYQLNADALSHNMQMDEKTHQLNVDNSNKNYAIQSASLSQNQATAEFENEYRIALALADTGDYSGIFHVAQKYGIPVNLGTSGEP